MYAPVMLQKYITPFCQRIIDYKQSNMNSNIYKDSNKTVDFLYIMDYVTFV